MSKNQKNNDKSGIIAIIIVTIILIVGITLTIFTLNSKSSIIIEKPEISVSIGTNDPQVFTVKFSFEGNVKKLNSISASEYEKLVIDALNSVGYEKLTDKDSTEHIKEAMKQQLYNKFNTDDFEVDSIYIDKLTQSKYTNPKNNTSPNPNNPNSANITDMFKKR